MDRMSDERLAALKRNAEIVASRKYKGWFNEVVLALEAERERVKELEVEAKDGFDQLAVSQREVTELEAKLDAEKLKHVETIDGWHLPSAMNRIDELEAKMDAVKNVKTFGMEASRSSDGTYRVVQWVKWKDVLKALGEAR